MGKPLILTFDMGTQSARAMLVDEDGNIVKKVKETYEKPYFSLNTDWAEQKPSFYWDAIGRISQNLKREAGSLWEEIIGVTCTTVRDTAVCVDKEGNPIRDIILWLDKRETIKEKKFSIKEKLGFGIVGMYDTVKLQYRVSISNWIQENEPEVWKKTYKFMMLSTYFSYLFCGSMKDSVANMIGHIPIDSKTRTWMKKRDMRRGIFNIEQEKLCEIVEPGTILGGITKTASEKTGIREGTPFIATGSDKGCETLGLSCSTPQKAAISFGTTATIQVTTDYYMEPLPFIPAYCAVIQNHYNPEIQIYRGYWLISWFKKEFAAKEVAEAKEKGISPEQLLNERLRSIKPGCEGLLLQPYFTPGVVMPKARGAMIGFSDVHSRLHVYRAIIEGINFGLMDGLRTLEKRGKFKVEELYVAGGGSQSDEICQITANMFGLPVKRVQTYEVSGLGSSMIAFVSLGKYKDLDAALEQMVRVRETFLPDLQETRLYHRLFERIFSKIFSKLLPLYKATREVLRVEEEE